MSYAHKLKYAGAKPYQPEREREDIEHSELELLEQDETYQRLAELRWLASELDDELNRDDLAEDSGARRKLFDAVAADAAPLQMMVARYVDAWLETHRAKQYHVVCHDCTLESVVDDEAGAYNTCRDHEEATSHDVEYAQVDTGEADS